MPTDLNGTPTSLGIGTYNVDSDAPSGLGFNEAMGQIDALLQTTLKTPTGIVTGEVPVWNGSAWVRSSVTGMTPSGISGYPNDVKKTLHGDGSWSSDELFYASTASGASITSAVSTSPTIFIPGSAVQYDGNPVVAEVWVPGVVPAAVAGNLIAIGIWENSTGSPLHYTWITNPSGASSWQMPLLMRTRFTPTVGNHTYSVGGFVTNTAGSVSPAGDVISLRITRASS